MTKFINMLKDDTGVMVNSDFLNGLTVKEAIPFMGVGLIAILVTTLCPQYINFFVNMLA